MSILEKSSAALQGVKANAKKSSSATMQALSAVLGDGFQDEDWASEGEEVAEDIPNMTESEMQVVKALGGYIITRLHRQEKLTCNGCRDSLLSSEQGILLQERQRDGDQLFSASFSLHQFLLTAEAEFRLAMCDESFCAEEQIGMKLRRHISGKVPQLLCCHPTAAADAVITLFLRVRLHHHCKLRNALIGEDRKQKRKERKLKRM